MKKNWVEPAFEELSIADTADKKWQDKSHGGSCPKRWDSSAVCTCGVDSTDSTDGLS